MPRASTITLPNWRITTRAAAIAAKAVKYCLRAVRRFTDLGSNGEALAHFETGLAQLHKLPDDDRRAELELDLRNAAGGSLGDSKGYGSFEAEQSAARAMELCQRPGINWGKTWSALFQIFFVQQLRPDVRKAEAIAAELIARAEEHARRRISGGSDELVGVREDGFGQLRARRSSLRPGVGAAGIHESRSRYSNAPKGSVHDRGSGTRQNNRILSGWNLWFLGYPDRALERMNIATAIAQEPGLRKISWPTYTDLPPTFMSFAASLSR